MEEKKSLNNVVRTIRHDFIKGRLSESTVSTDPFRQFGAWLEHTVNGGNELANAMVLSTVNSEGMPSSRVMLLRDVSHGGFTFFTNYSSHKGRDLVNNPKASLLFFWPEHERQVRVQGEVRLLPVQESDAYFSSRPFGSQVGAHASAQSSVISGRKELDDSYERTLDKYRNGYVPRPAHWGGYVLVPSLFEFWQGRASRLHDRLQYRLQDGKWIIERLMP